MNLNLPILDQLSGCSNILIAGIGGGFDIFCGLPLYFELRERGWNVHLASLTDASLKRMIGARRLTPSLIGVLPTTESSSPYFPELYLSRWFREQIGEEMIVWCFEKLGVQPLIRNYQALIKALDIDAIILIDGGVDSLIRGDEAEIGSVAEDSTSLAAVNSLTDLLVRITCCLGFGAELEISHAQVLENIADLSKNEAFLGACALTQPMKAYQNYEQALLYVQKQQRQDASVINSSVISAVRGEYGDYHLTSKTRDSGRTLWISPFMPFYWFFDLEAVAKENLFLADMSKTETFDEVRRSIQETRSTLSKRPASAIPLA